MLYSNNLARQDNISFSDVTLFRFISAVSIFISYIFSLKSQDARKPRAKELEGRCAGLERFEQAITLHNKSDFKPVHFSRQN
ncbi:MAG TPA: hypothetical protein DCP92_16755 [Nitrospiraceae bacterium]|nr:hypothetical protein [Nitrospiraceae bacterium]